MTFKVSATNVVDCGPPRISSRSVSWNSTGFYLAFGSSDWVTRIVTVDAANQSVRDVLTITGHSMPVNKVRFHVSEPSILMTAAADHTVRLFDCRNATQRAIGTIDIHEGKAVLAAEWCRDASYPHHIVVTERSSKMYIYDTRHISSGQPAGKSDGAVKIIDPSPEVVETAIFSPDGRYIISGSTERTHGMGDLVVWDWKTASEDEPSVIARYPGHSGPIYAMDLSPDKAQLATGGSDAVVGLWDTDSMCCSRTMARCSKFIRSVAFSHDSKILACSTEENDVDLSDPSSGASVGTVTFGNRRGGAEDLAWHPTMHMLACAKTDTHVGLAPSPIAVAKLTLSKSTQ